MVEMLSVAMATFNCSLLDFDARLKFHIDLSNNAKEQGIEIILFPELSISGYGLEDLFFADWISTKAWESVDKLVTHSKTLPGLVIVLGAPLILDNGLYNAAVVVQDGKVCGIVPKVALANDNVHYEARWFRSGRDLEALYCGAKVGPHIFKLGNLKFGIAICEDLWVNREGLDYLDNQVDLILNPSASHFAIGKLQTKRALWLECSRRFNAAIATTNILGLEAGELLYDGYSALICEGKVQGSGLFSGNDSELFVRSFPAHKLFARKLYATRTDGIAETELARVLAPTRTVTQSPFVKSSNNKFAEFIAAVTIGLRDYLRKSNQKGYVLSLSGGRDSSLVLILLAIMCERYYQGDINDVVKAAYLKCKASSSATLASAEALAKHLGVALEVVDLRKIVVEYESFFPTTDRLSRQNLQARARSTAVWLLANESQSILLTTGNRSELSVGYTTIDGDSSGGLNPIGGVSKSFINELLAYLLDNGYAGMTFSPLASVLAVPPSAELEGEGDKITQFDEDDLMPYELLQAIEELYVYYGYSFDQILELLKTSRGAKINIDVVDNLTILATINDEDLENYLAKFARLFAISQWKRHRAAPTFHVDKYNLNYRSWLRYPILSKGS